VKIHILYDFQEAPWGGGNQFLKALKREFERQGIYAGNPLKTHVILFNSHHQLKDILKLKANNPSKVLIHRLGPIFYYHRGKKWKPYDQSIIKLTNEISDAVVFQSKWAWQEAMRLRLSKHQSCKVIYNAVDPAIFNKSNKNGFNPKGKIKLIATSWSSNWHKGFDIYRFLDENLDFKKYAMTFIGNSLIKFKNIKWIKPIPSQKLAGILGQYDIYIIASRLEACSNSLIEAISCGLPTVAINSGSNPELIQEGGKLFDGEMNVLAKIEEVAQHYDCFQSNLPCFSIEEAAQRYYEFAEGIYDGVQKGTHKAKKVNFLTRMRFLEMKCMILKWKIVNKVKSVTKGLWEK
jgi:glycosyltransferase involved in cell wall biosynthesis